jgi:hypothetical protein
MFTKKTAPKSPIDTTEEVISFVYSHIDFFAAPFNQDEKVAEKISFEQWARSLKNMDAERIKQLDSELKSAILGDEKTPLTTNETSWARLFTEPLPEEDQKNQIRQLLAENHKLLSALTKIKKNRIIEKWYKENADSQTLERRKNRIREESLRSVNLNNISSNVIAENTLINTIELLFFNIEYFTQIATPGNTLDKHISELHTYLLKMSNDLKLPNDKTLHFELIDALIGQPNNPNHIGCLINIEFTKITNLLLKYPLLKAAIHDFYRPIKKAEINDFYQQPANEASSINKKQREYRLYDLKKNIINDENFSHLYITKLTPVIDELRSIIENVEFRLDKHLAKKIDFIRNLYRILVRNQKNQNSTEHQLRTFDNFYKAFSEYKPTFLSDIPEHGSLSALRLEENRSDNLLSLKPPTIYYRPASLYLEPKANTIQTLMRKIDNILTELKTSHNKTSAYYRELASSPEVTSLTPAAHMA